MSALGQRAAQAQANLTDVEAALDKTQQALQLAEKVDEAATKVKRRSGKFVKLVLVLTVIGVAVVVAKKVMGGGSNPPGNPDPYGSDSTEK